jgi:hypothetical protein
VAGDGSPWQNGIRVKISYSVAAGLPFFAEKNGAEERDADRKKILDGKAGSCAVSQSLS